jgi:hypothetical protein
MQQVPADISAAFQRRLDQAQVPPDQRPDYHKWVRFYLDFCTKYGHSPALPTSLGPFLTKLAAKNQSVDQRNRASVAVSLLTG